MSDLESTLRRWARWPVILGLAFLSLAFMVIMFPLFTPLSDVAPPDTRLAYTVADLEQAVILLSSAQRVAVVRARLTLDMVYPMVYGLLIALLLVRTSAPRRAWALAPLAVAADWTENILLSLIYLHPQKYLAALGAWAAAVTTLKWGVIAVAVVVVVIRAASRLRRS